jgi:hypothetical protein|nr:hypothetical protein [uncultured Rhodopila sp.]
MNLFFSCAALAVVVVEVAWRSFMALVAGDFRGAQQAAECFGVGIFLGTTLGELAIVAHRLVVDLRKDRH